MAATRLPVPEFVALIAFALSMVAMSIDSMLPALGVIASSLGVTRENDRQLVLMMFFSGLTVGQLVYGPAADALGRRRAMFVGLGVLIIGTVLCATATSFLMILAGRLIAGFGAAAPRIVSTAVVRDLYAGRAMARIMSIAMAIFILIPIVAPSVGQGLLLLGSWRAIFLVLLVMATLVGLWFGLRQPETLAIEDRQPLSLRPVGRAFAETLTNRVTLAYALAGGLVYGAMIAFLGTAQQTFAEQYGLGDRFPLYFAGLATALGTSSLVNARLVTRCRMRHISGTALRVSTTSSAFFLCIAIATGGHPPLSAFVAYLVIVFFCHGLMFGNFNALAMEPMGHIAGSAAAVIGSMSSLISVAVATPIGRAYDGTVIPLVGGLACLTMVALVITWWVERTPMHAHGRP